MTTAAPDTEVEVEDLPVDPPEPKQKTTMGRRQDTSSKVRNPARSLHYDNAEKKARGTPQHA